MSSYTGKLQIIFGEWLQPINETILWLLLERQNLLGTLLVLSKLLLFNFSYCGGVLRFYLFGSSLLLSSMLCSPITTDIVFGLTTCKTTDKKFTKTGRMQWLHPFTWHNSELSLHILLASPFWQSGPGLGGWNIQCAAVITHWSAIKVPAQDSWVRFWQIGRVVLRGPPK